MSTDGDTIGIVRDHRWMRAAEQQRHLKEVCRIIMVLGDTKGRDGKGKVLEDILPLVRPGTVVHLMYAFLLTDPGKKSHTGSLRRAAFDRALSLVVDQRKGVVKDALTGLSTETKDKRRALALSAHDQIRRSNQGRSSQENGARSRGRPKRWADPAHRQIIWHEWHSTAHATNTEAAEEASRQMGQRITHYVMWRIVNEMRKAKGLKGKGASGRRPNSAAAALAAEVGKPDPNRPLPKARIPRGVVYFVKNGVRDRVKIGFSAGHKNRLSALQNASPDALTLIGVLSGTIKTERRLHKRFQEYREKGEWFRIEGTLARFLRVTFPKTKRT